jgi:hypothetical protein
MSCVDKVYDALAQKVTKKQIQTWVDKINAEGQYDPATLMQKVTEFGREKLHETYIRKRNTALLLQKERQVYDYVAENFKDNPIKGLQAVLGGVQSYKSGSRLSSDLAQKQLRYSYVNDLEFGLIKNGVFDKFASGEMDMDVARELADLNTAKPSGKATNNREAKEVARIVKESQDRARLRANAAGADIAQLEGYFMTQTHDMFKLRKVSEDDWVDDVTSKIDIKKSFGDVTQMQARNILKRMYKNLASGEQYKIDFGDPVLSSSKKSANLGGAISKSRVLQFQSPDKAMEYNNKYGTGNLRENIFHNLTKLADKTGLMETMGPNPQEVLDRVFTRLGANADSPTAIKMADNKVKVEKLLSVLDGSSNIPGNPTGAKWMSAARAVQSMAKLGGAVISSVTDIPVSASELMYQGKGFLSSYNDAIIGPYKAVPAAKRKELAMQMGIFFDSMLNDMVGRFSGREEISGKMSKAVNQFFRWSGLTGWTNRLRANVALAMSGRLGMLSGQNFSKLEPDLQRVLGLYNIGEKEWGLMRKAVTDESGHRFITSEGVAKLSDKDVLDAYKGDASSQHKTADELRQNLSDKLRSYYIDRSEIAVVQPDARTVALLRQATRPGTVEGEFMRSITQFKAFPFAFFQKVYGREIYGREGFDKSNIMGLAHVILATTAYGYGAMVAKDLLKGQEPREPTNLTTIMAAFHQGGGLGIYGDFLFGTSNRFGGKPIETAAGPLLGEASRAIEIIQAIRDGDDPSAKGIQLLKGNVPFINLFYLRAALDYSIMYRLQEAVNPGYLRRMEERAKEDNDQEFIIPPSSVIPRGGF